MSKVLVQKVKASISMHGIRPVSSTTSRPPRRSQRSAGGVLVGAQSDHRPLNAPRTPPQAAHADARVRETASGRPHSKPRASQTTPRCGRRRRGWPLCQNRRASGLRHHVFQYYKKELLVEKQPRLKKDNKREQVEKAKLKKLTTANDSSLMAGIKTINKDQEHHLQGTNCGGRRLFDRRRRLSTWTGDTMVPPKKRPKSLRGSPPSCTRERPTAAIKKGTPKTCAEKAEGDPRRVNSTTVETRGYPHGFQPPLENSPSHHNGLRFYSDHRQ